MNLLNIKQKSGRVDASKKNAPKSDTLLLQSCHAMIAKYGSYAIKNTTCTRSFYYILYDRIESP